MVQSGGAKCEPELSVVIPTFNERENVEILIPALEDMLEKHRITSEIIIVDDNSPDKTGEAAEKLNIKYKNITVVVRTKEKGIASAWFHGYSIARGDYIATMDADLCHRPEDLIKMYEQLPGYDIVIGSRYMDEGSGMTGKSAIHIIASKVAQHVIKFFIGINETDMTHSFRVFKRGVFHSIKNELNTTGNVFLVMFLHLAAKKGYSIKEVPIEYGKRKYGKTKLNVYSEGARFMGTAVQIYIKNIFGKSSK
jgi:dolichol-phosphate mannosyltransferase